MLKLKRKEGRRPAILLGLHDKENDSGVITVYARRLQTPQESLTIPVSASINAQQVIQEAVARFRLEPTDSDLEANMDTYQLVSVTLEAGRGTHDCFAQDLISDPLRLFVTYIKEPGFLIFE